MKPNPEMAWINVRQAVEQSIELYQDGLSGDFAEIYACRYACLTKMANMIEDVDRIPPPKRAA